MYVNEHIKEENQKIKGFRRVAAAFVASADATEENRASLLKLIAKLPDKYYS